MPRRAQRRQRDAGKDVWFVDSPAVGTGLQLRPCDDALRSADLAASDEPFAVTLSGVGSGQRSPLSAV